MKKKILINQLRNFGWWLLRQGGRHEIWTNGDHVIPVPRHREINDLTANAILRKARLNPSTDRKR